MQKLLFFWEELKSNFWFVPILILILAIGAAIGLINLDNTIDYRPEGILQYFFTGSVESARSVLSTISGAMIGVAGTVFSITLVALTLASSQFGSRLLRNFMHERINQVVLGTYISTYAYCLIVMNAMKDNEQLSFIPSFSVFFAILATIVNITLLIVFIHHIAISIQADKVISDIYESLSENIDHLFPEKIGTDDPEEAPPNMEVLKSRYPYHQHMLSDKSGYLQYVDEQAILNKAIDEDLIIELNYKPGDYLVQDMKIGKVYGQQETEEDSVQLQGIFIIGDVRTPQQDLEFSIHQIVEIAGRALSPGINDPYTAIACIDNLTSTLCYLTKVKFPSKYRYDEESNLRIIAKPLTFEGMLNAAFNKIRQYSVGNPSVMIRLMEALGIIHSFAKVEDQKKALLKHAEMVFRAARSSLEEKNDLEDFQKRWRAMQEVSE